MSGWWWRRDQLLGGVTRDNGGTWTALPMGERPVSGFRSEAAAVMAALSRGGTR